MKLASVVEGGGQVPDRKAISTLEGVEFCSSPVTSLGVVADGVVSAKTDPLRERTVLIIDQEKGKSRERKCTPYYII